MKKSNNSRQVVFIIGFITLLTGTFFTISQSLATSFFSIYIGLALMGIAALHKERRLKL